MKNFKFHPKHLTWLMPLILSGIMSGAISCFNLFLKLGWVDGFFSIWLHAWSLSWLMAFPLILIVLPLVRNTLMKFVEMPK
ncbi:DUF2798 domain-containing protein [Acinetobacter wanghuae]|uniref:DUF2798 domain-containing protein n=1 Tax=Acinetobacter wanghuae TaxID=2662362 RepID=A0A5Q0P235_9GAMM|nr:DUF2798 domain-containing protein [Acinetobacter wanghuae]MQW92700.1 DUF2798 domain-containing protein [Acinetobacter wanghuae]QGA10603.1 DUF2798 domain-containing protein [Acinetobacter wanghuae]